MVNMKRLWAMLLGFLLLSGGCINLKQPGNRIQFYDLEYEPPSIKGLVMLPYSLKVDRFHVTATYNTTQIIYRDRSFKRDAYAYNRWRDNPGDIVTHFLNRDIRHSGLFRAVLPYDSGLKTSFTLTGTVDEFLEWDSGEDWNALLSISVILIDNNEPDITKKILFQRSYSRKEACRQKDPRGLAEAMSLAMARLSGEVIRDIHDHIAGH